MKLIIDIPEEVYKSIQDNDYCGISNSDMYNVVKNGTPLPKGHGDLISRQAVIDMLNKLIEVEQKQGTDVMNYGRERVNAYESILDEIESDYLFPSITSAEKTTLSAEKTTITDGDLISRESVKDLIRGLTKWGVRSQDGKFENVGLLYDDVMFGIDRLPSAEKTAEWIKQKSGDELFPEEIVCSKCYHSNSHLDFDEHNNPIGKVFLESKYCPNCGARMKGVE